jgi:anti-sigma regulatory factor (Ser/Thr protein kinase)
VSGIRRTDRGVSHQGLFYRAVEDLPGAVGPLITQRLAAGQPVLAVVPAAITTALHLAAHEVGPTGITDGLRTDDPERLCRQPGQALRRYRTHLEQMSPDGRPVTIVTAPPSCPDPHRAALWMHVEAVTEQALTGHDLTLICAYPDKSATADAVREAHPIIRNGVAATSRAHVAAEEFLSRHPLPPPPDLGPPSLDEVITGAAALSRLRTVLAEFGGRSGLTAERCDDLVLATTEIATNAVEHGAGTGVLRGWNPSACVVVEVTDAGRFSAPLVGLLHPRPEQTRGRGVWLAHQLCDSVYLWTDPTTTVRLIIDTDRSITTDARAET